MIAMSVIPELKATILHLYHVEKMRIGTIASQLQVNRTTISNILAQAGLLNVQETQRGMLLETFWPFVRQTLEKYPRLPVSQLYQMVCIRGYNGGPDHFRHIIALHRQELKPELPIAILPKQMEAQTRKAHDEEQTKTPAPQNCKSALLVKKDCLELEAEIIHAYHIYKWTTGTIASQLMIHRDKVDRVIAESGFPLRRRVNRSTYMASFEPQIQNLLSQRPTLSTRRLYEIVKEQGYPGNFDHFRHRIPIYRSKFDSFEWLLSLLQKKIDSSEVKRDVGENAGFDVLLDRVYSGKLHDRNKSIVILGSHFGLPITGVCNFLGISGSTHADYLRSFREGGIDKLFSRKAIPRRSDDESLKKAIFSLLHEPPSKYGINRTTWTMALLKRILLESGNVVSPTVVREITRAAGYKWRKARIVLTSNDPNYSEKLDHIHSILEDLQADEAFFSIDEYGPFSIKTQGGLVLSGPGEQPTVPQWQKSRGSLIVTAALELGSNQITHFYSDKKNTNEMISMMSVLIDKYRDRRKLYLSWDAASWHISKLLNKRVDEHNLNAVSDGGVLIETVPLPSGAQFLNVIESVFSGMSRAIIHNSDYPSVGDAKEAIDRYFSERNTNFQETPRRAGKKIWGREREPASFSDSNNCKDPRYR